MATHDSDVLTRLQSLTKSQETRIALYQEFEEAYQDYLDDKCPPEQYYSICKIVTEGFQEVSLEIQTVEKQLVDDFGRSDLGLLIRQLQQFEKEKLTLTAHLQIYTIESKKGEKDYDTTIETTRSSLQHTLEKIQEIWDELRQEITDLSYTNH